MKVPFVDDRSVTITASSLTSSMACAPDTVGTAISSETLSDAWRPTTTRGPFSSKSPGISTSSPRCSIVFGPQFLSSQRAANTRRDSPRD